MALEDTLENISYNISEVAANIGRNTNAFGQTVGDELHEMNFHLKTIAESLEIIAKNMK
jgi:hypothetical protein